MMVTKSRRQIVLYYVTLFILSLSYSSKNGAVVRAQFGIPRQQQAEVGANGEINSNSNNNNNDLVAQLAAAATSLPAPPTAEGGTPSTLTEQQLVDVATVIESAKSDPETSLLLLRMKEQGSYQAMANELSASQIVLHLVQTVEEMKALEILFTSVDPDRAVEELIKEGMAGSKERHSEFRKNPSALREEMEKGLYFTFVSIAASGGYL